MAKELTSQPGRKKIWIILLILVGIMVILGIGAYLLFLKPVPSTGTWTPIDLTTENLPSYLSQFSPIQELPEEGVILLAVGDTKYTITRGGVSPGAPAQPDIALTLPESYLKVIGERGWCAGLSQARANGDLGVALQGSETSLAFKYRVLAKYRSCFG